MRQRQSRDAGTSSPSQTWAFGLGIALLLVLRLLWLSADPLLISPSGLYLTDEGWYSKAALNLVHTGRAEAADDFVPITHTFGYTWLGVQWFRQFGIALLPLRALSAGLSILGTLLLAGSIKRAWGTAPAFKLAFALAINLLLLSLSRLALPDSLAFALLCIAMAMLIPPRPGNLRSCCCALLAFALSAIKLSYLPVTLWLGLVLVYRHQSRGARPLQKARTWGFLMLPLVTLAALYRNIYLSYPEAWAMFSDLNLQGRMITGPLSWLANIFYAIAADLWSTGALGLAVFLVHRHRGFFQSWMRKPEVLGLFGLLLLNFTARSLIWYHPPRYGLVTLLVLLLLSVHPFAADQGPPNSRPSARFWLLCVLLGQVPQWVALARNQVSGHSMRHAAHAIHRILGSSSHPRLLYGTGSASFVALLHPEIRPVDVSDQAATMCTRIGHYGEGYLLIDPRKSRDFALPASLQQCNAPVKLEFLWSQVVLNNYYRQGPWQLYRLSRPRAPAQQGSNLRALEHPP